MWTNHVDLTAVANALNIKIEVVLVNGLRDANPSTSIIGDLTNVGKTIKILSGYENKKLEIIIDL